MVLSFLCVLRAVQFRIYGVVFDIIDTKPIGLQLLTPPINWDHHTGPNITLALNVTALQALIVVLNPVLLYLFTNKSDPF